MPPVVILVVSMLAASNTIYASGHNLTSVIKALHHHTTKPVYSHVIKPVAKTLAK